MPLDFKIIDSATSSANNKHAKKVTERAGYDVDTSRIKRLITATKGSLNSFSLNTTNSNFYTKENWELNDSLGKERVVKIMNNQTTIKPEISYTSVKIDDREFIM